MTRDPVAEPIRAADRPLDELEAGAGRLLSGPSQPLHSGFDLFQHAPIGCLLTDHRGTILQSNDLAARFLNLPARTLNGMSLAAFVPDAERQAFEAQLRPLALLQGVRQWDLEMQPRGARPRFAAWSVATLANGGGAGRRLFWSLRDITESQRAMQELHESEIKHRWLAETTLAGLCVIQDGHLVYANGRLAELLGHEVERLIGIEIEQLVAPESLKALAEELRRTDRHEMRRAHSTSEAPHRVQSTIRMLHRSGSSLDVEILGTVTLYDGKPAFFATIVEQTAQQRTLEVLQGSESRYRRLIEEAGDAILLTNRDGSYVEVNARACEMLGYTREELLRLREQDLILGGERSVEPHEGESLPKSAVVLERRLRRKDGSLVEAEINAKILHDGRTLCIARDVSGRSHVSADVFDSDLRYRLVAKATNDAIWDWDLRTDAVTWSDGIRTLFGYPENAVGGDTGWWYEHIHPDDRQRVVCGIHAAVDRGAQHWSEEYLFRRYDGSYAYVLDRGYIVREEPAIPVRMIGCMTDHTARQRAEQALQESEEKHRILAEETPVGVYIAQAGQITYVNERGAEILGYAPTDVLGRHVLEFVPPANRDVLDAWLRSRPSGEEKSLRGRGEAIHRDGHVLEIEAYGSHVRLNGEPCIIVTVLDRTEEQHASEAMLRSELGYRGLMEQAADTILVTDSKGLILDANSRASEMLGYEHRELLGMNLQQLISPQDSGAAGLELEELHPGKAVSVELHLRCKTGPTTPVETHGRMLSDGRVSWIVRDVSKRKQDEEKLHQAEERYRSLVEQLPGIIYVATMDGLREVLYISPQVEAKLGFPSEGWLQPSQLWHQRLHPDDRNTVLAELGRCAEQELPFVCEYRLLDSDDEVIWVRDEAIIIRDARGERLLQGVMLDISERQAERAGRERMRGLTRYLVQAQESERRRIGLELHDEVGGTLTGVKLILGTLLRLPAWEAQLRVAEVQRQLGELIGRVRDMSVELRPQVLDDLGLRAALLRLFDRYHRQTDIRVHFHHKGLGVRFGSDLETALYRVVQEALTNVARHAGVKEVTVRAWADGSVLGVQIVDAGTGFDPNALDKATNGLAGMRERIAILHGELTVEAAPGEGCCLMAELPLQVESKE